MKPLVALVQGDATGIGPELLAKLLALPDATGRADLLVVSDARVFAGGCEVAGVAPAPRPLDERLLDDPRALRAAAATGPLLFDVPLDDEDFAALQPGRVSTAAGAAVLEGFGRALDLAAAGTVDGVCFMPFNKQAMHQAGLGVEDELRWAQQRLDYQGQVGEYNVVDGLWNARVTSHVPLREVAGLLSVERIVAAVRLADATLRRAGVARPRIAVAALNPHAGDGGAIGREEIDVIGPAVEAARGLQIGADGPFPSDTLYLKLRDRQYDCAVSMYHDQGQIAIKLLGFERGVTVHGGLPVPLTTPAHGTAFDIVGRNAANVEPSRRALAMVAEMAANRQAGAR